MIESIYYNYKIYISNNKILVLGTYVMPLSIKLPAKEKIIINGAVIENAGDATTIILHNKVDLLRRKEVMTEAEATTPAKRVYYTCQCAYLFDDQREEYLKILLDFVHDYATAAPSSADICQEIQKLITEERYYTALKRSQKLIQHEAQRLESVGYNPVTGQFQAD